MTSFTNGPAKGQTLMLKRAPIFLRVVQDNAGEFDALSVRQPWAWLIVRGFKTFENRDWSPNYAPRQFVNNQAPFRCLIHASSGITKPEYAQCESIVSNANWLRVSEGNRPIELPAFDQLERGGILGSVEVLHFCTRAEPGNPWSFGPGLMLGNPELLPFTPCRGALGFFKPHLTSSV